MFSFYLMCFSINAILIERNIFNTKLQVVFSVKHRDPKQKNLHKHYQVIFGILDRFWLEMNDNNS